MSARQGNIPQETLNALLDRQFSPDEQAGKMSEVRNDAEAAAELCRLRDLKESVRVAYAEVPQPESRSTGKPSGRLPLAAAAAVLLLLGTALLLQHGLTPTMWSEMERFALLDPQGRGQRAAAATDGGMRVVFHVQNVDTAGAGELLDEVEGLLRELRGRQQPLRVEVVAHGEGLALLRARLTDQRERIGRMAREYPELTFVACRNTIERLKVEQGIEVVLVPEARSTASGVAHVVQRQSEGWVYIQV